MVKLLLLRLLSLRQVCSDSVEKVLKLSLPHLPLKDLKSVFLVLQLRKLLLVMMKIQFYSSFTGSLAEKFSKGNYAGSGSLFHIGDRVERATFSYNTSSVVEGYGTQDMVSLPTPLLQLKIMVLLVVHLNLHILIMVIWSLFLVKRIHSVCSELLVETAGHKTNICW